MKKYSKAGLLIVTLVIPALIFTFLRFFATNHYNIPYYFPITDNKGNVEIVGGDTVFYKVENLNMADPGGKSADNFYFQGKLTVLNYLPENCNDSCRILQNSLERIYSLRDKITTLNLLTISDLDNSDVKDLTEKEAWSIIRFPHAKLNVVLNDSFKFETKVPKAKTNAVESKLVLIDTEEHIRGYYNGYDPEEINRLMAEIKILDFEEKESSRK